MKRMIRHGRGGFTLVELLIVISVLAVLAAILIPTFSTVGRNQRQSACYNNLRELGVALAQYRQDYGAYPAAPRPEYLNSRGMEYEAMPFDRKTLIGRATFTGSDKDDNLCNVMLTGGEYWASSTITITVIIDGTGNPNTFKWQCDGTEMRNAVAISGQYQPLADEEEDESPVKGVTVSFPRTTGHDMGDTWTFKVGPDVLTDIGWAGWELKDGRYEVIPFTDPALADPKKKMDSLVVGNFGLATLYNLYLHDRRDYVRQRQLFHCPAMKDTEGVELGANINAVAQAGRSFDPLWAGFNTYDVTYNYDQYYNDILYFDAALNGMSRDDFESGLPDTANQSLNVKRQLRNANPPADTVVTWCFAHQREQAPSYTVPIGPDLTFEVNLDDGLTEEECTQAHARALRDIRQQVDSAERGRKSQVSLVLWVDGTVSVERPRLMRGATAENLHHYFWVPPFLYSTGAWRE